MKFNYDRLIRAKRTANLVRTCSVSIDQAVAVAVSSIGGTVFDVKLKEVNQQTVWRLKLLRSGERVKVFVDAKAGKILEAKAEMTGPKAYQDIDSSATAISLSDNH
jgi:uncharacterized membrane protein YkoI